MQQLMELEQLEKFLQNSNGKDAQRYLRFRNINLITSKLDGEKEKDIKFVQECIVEQKKQMGIEKQKKEQEVKQEIKLNQVKPEETVNQSYEEFCIMKSFFLEDNFNLYMQQIECLEDCLRQFNEKEVKQFLGFCDIELIISKLTGEKERDTKILQDYFIKWKEQWRLKNKNRNKKQNLNKQQMLFNLMGTYFIGDFVQ